MRRRNLIALVAGLLALCACAVAVSAANLGAPEPQAGSPALVVPVGAMERLPPDPAAPPKLVDVVRDVTSRRQGNPESSVQSLRKLQSGLGLDANSIYAFSPDGTAVCIAIWRRTVACPDTLGPLPEVLWGYNGGYPATIAGIKRDVPSSITGLFSDNVSDIAVLADSDEVGVNVANNSFFAELSDPSAARAREFTLRATYADGAIKSTVFRNPNP